MQTVTILLFLSALIPSLGLVAVVYGTIRKTQSGINLRPVKACPTCGTPFGKYFRKPDTFTQAMWGGYSCSKCGTQVDKWGRQVDGGHVHPMA